MDKDQEKMASGNHGDAAACGTSPGPGCSTSSLLYEKACMERTAYYLSLSPMCQARAIAKHYCAYAMIARDLLEILECVAQGSNQNADTSIEHIVKTITDGHAHDFGLPLAWSNPRGQGLRSNTLDPVVGGLNP